MDKEEKELIKGTQITLPTAGQLNMQAVLGFTLVGTNLYALYQKAGTENTFLVMPAPGQSSYGMTIDDMVKEINSLFQNVTQSQDPGLDSTAIETSIGDVVSASEKKTPSQEGELKGFDWSSIKVFLEQAFLYLHTGTPAEYAFSIRIDTSQLFGSSSFFNVSGLSLGIWNTDRKLVLERMALTDVGSALAQLQ